MILEKIKTPGLAHLSYFLGSGQDAAVIDPRRDIEIYLRMARQNDCRITHIFETHRNEDLVSGSARLSEVTGAEVFHGPNADGPVAYAQTVHEKDQFRVGDCVIEVLETPGHTKDSVCYLLKDQQFDQGAIGIFTGDTLFVGDVGRTDFYPEDQNMAAALYNSLHKIRQSAPLAIIYPAHGAGSVCGDGMADREFSTVAHEFRNNPALTLESQDQFIERKHSETHYQPPYFQTMEQLNLQGDKRSEPGRNILKWNDIEKLSKQGSVNFVDVRNTSSFASGHFPGAYCIPQPMISAYAGWYFGPDQSLVLIAADRDEALKAYEDFYRIGFDNIEGYYLFELPSHVAQGRPHENLKLVNVETVQRRLEDGAEWQLIDVRKVSEWEEEKLSSAQHIFLGHLPEQAGRLNKDKPTMVMCQSGSRATIGAGILLRAGFNQVEVFNGSMGAWISSRS